MVSPFRQETQDTAAITIVIRLKCIGYYLSMVLYISGVHKINGIIVCGTLYVQEYLIIKTMIFIVVGMNEGMHDPRNANSLSIIMQENNTPI